jgi:hypothetical protein
VAKSSKRAGAGEVLVLQRAFELRAASAALLESVLEFMTKAETAPSLTFEDWIK